MLKKIVGFILLAIGCQCTLAASLCIDKDEEVIFSFKKKGEFKYVSICKEVHAAYLVYRFGTPQRIELQFPAELNSDSWKKFRLNGRYRGGGKRNLAFSEYALSFENGGVEYLVNDIWDAVEETYSINVIVGIGKKRYEVTGDKNTQEGSLRQLEWESEHIQNKEFSDEPR
jgi:hypothetical protein